MARQTVRRVRHWRQRFNPEAEFVWARPVTFDGRHKKAGTKVDKRKLHPNKLRRLWFSRFIEEANWKAPVVHNPFAKEAERVVAVG